jgi:iron complex outermembrane receptor protein
MQSQAAPQLKELDPLVVTAERDSGTVLISKDLDLFQVESVADLSGVAPGLFVVTGDNGGYGDIISMRGSANTLFFSPPAVGMVVDDVPMGEVSSYPAGLLAMDHIGVYRGPQGTTYGRNGAAGMIEMTTPRPGKDNEIHMSTDYGSYDSWGATLQTGGPLGGGISQALQLYHQERDGFMHNTTLGNHPDDRSISGGLANLYWKPTEDTEWRLRILAEREDDGSQRLSRLDSADPFEVASDIPGETVVERQQVSLHWTKEGTWGRLKSITAWQNWQLDPSVTDLDLRNTPGFGMSSRIVQDQKMWTQEFRWESPEDAGPWSWRTGVFFMDQSSGGDTLRVLGGPFSESINYQTDQWNLAAYGRAFYAVNANLKLLAGVRLEYVDTHIDRTKTSTFAPAGPPVHDGMGECYLSPELGASYVLSDSVRLFARSAIGVKPAGFSAFASIPVRASYDDETAWTNEVGAEYALPENHLSFSLTGFLNRIHDYQVNRPDLFSTDYFTVNADQVTSLGLEAEIKWQPVNGLTVHGGAGYVNTEFDDYHDPLLPGVKYDGNKVPFVPEFTASLGARYDFPKGFYLQSSVKVAGSTYFNEANDRAYRQGSYCCWDAEFGYTGQGFTIALFGRNLMDEEYYTYINSQIKAGSPGDPQVFGLRAAYEF